MPEITYFTGLFDAILLPLLALIALIMAKFCCGEAARFAERQFLALLVVMTMITLRTVIRCDDVWLIHTTTLALMIVGSLVIPSQKPSVAI